MVAIAARTSADGGLPWIRRVTADPEWSALAFALKTFVAALLALFFAFWLGLDEPRWAILTVFVVAQSESGLVIAKSFYRILGTVAGLIVAVALVFDFAQYETMFLTLLAVWVGVCNYGARTTRNFMSYGFLLAGYCTAIVGIPAALNPNAAYTLVIARFTEILLGIASAALVSRLLFPHELVPKLLGLVRGAIAAATRLGTQALDPTADRQRLEKDEIGLVQDLASIDAMRASAFFESADARLLDGPIREATVCALKLCAIAGDAAARQNALPRSVPATPSLLPAQPHDTPGENSAIVSVLTSVADRQAVEAALAGLGKAESALRGRANASMPSPSLPAWSDSLTAALTGLRTAFAIIVVSAFWIETAWPSGPVAVIVTAAVCSLIASMDRPATISLALAVTILASSAPVFVTIFYLLPFASDFFSMSMALAPLLLACAFIMAHPGVGPLGQLCAVYFTVGSNIDNVMSYDPVAFFNTSLAILFGIGVALVTFATVFPETPTGTLRRFMRLLSIRLSRFCADRGTELSSFAYGLSDLLAATSVRVKEDPVISRCCSAMAMSSLSTGYAIERLKHSLRSDQLAPQILAQIEMLLRGVSQAFLRPSRAGLTRWAWEARALRRRSLSAARASKAPEEMAALDDVVVGSEMLRTNLLKQSGFFHEGPHVG